MKQLLSNLKNVENNRNLQKFLLLVLICMISILTVAYATLNTVLKINGNAEVSAASWDIYLDNPKVTSGSVTNAVPIITNKTTASFTTTLTNPGDFYEFTIDVVNNGSIDAIIDSIEKLPSLTSNQAKYINYIIKYENGNEISTKQLVENQSFVRLKVKIEYRKDLYSDDLPNTNETLNLSFKLNYIQSNNSNENTSIDNNGKLIKIVKGDGTNTSDEICIGNECFYVMYSNEDSITMLSKYNLLVGNQYDQTNGLIPLKNETGVQDESAKGWFDGYSSDNPTMGINVFSHTAYWTEVIEKPIYVYNEQSNLYKYIENYKIYLETLGININEARLISIDELEAFGCIRVSNSCSEAPSWIYLTSYWTGNASDLSNVWGVYRNSDIDYKRYQYTNFGIRPVIVIDRSLI